MRGIFLLGRQRIVCLCSDCGDKPEASRMFSCTQFEMHCGAGAAKKWKASLRIEPGGVPEVKPGSLSRPQATQRCLGLPAMALCLAFNFDILADAFLLPTRRVQLNLWAVEKAGLQDWLTGM